MCDRCWVPFTFVSQQGTVLWLPERVRWVDGVALVVGTMAPDLAYITRGWGYGPDGLALWFDGHRFQNLLVLTIGSWIVAWLTRRVVLPVAARAVPAFGALHLRDFAYLSERRPRWWATYVSALAGSVVHLGIDVFIHPDEPVVEHVAFLHHSLGMIGGLHVRPYALIDLGLSVVFAVVALRWFVVVGRERAFRPVGTTGEVAPLSGPALGLFWACTVLGVAGGVAYAIHRVSSFGEFVAIDSATAPIAFAWVAFAGALAGSLAVRLLQRVAAPRPAET